MKEIFPEEAKTIPGGRLGRSNKPLQDLRGRRSVGLSPPL